MSGRISNFPAADAPKDFGTDKEGRARRWLAEIEKAHKERNEWFNQCRRILDRYRDAGPGRKGIGQDYTWGMRFNIFWSNVQTLAPSLYATSPKVVIERRWGDPDDIGRVACLILQRSTQYQLDGCDFDSVMRNVVLDHLLCGQGTAWVRYEPRFDKLPAFAFGGPMAQPMEAGTPPPAAPPPPPMVAQAAPGMAGPGGLPPPGMGGAPPPPMPLPPGIAPGSAPPPGGPPPGPMGAGGPLAGSTPPPAPGPPPGVPGAGPGAPPPPPFNLRPPMPPPGMPVTPPGQPGMGGGPPDLGGFQPPLMAALPPIPPGGLPVGHIDTDEHIGAGTNKPFDGAVQVADDGQDEGTFLAFEEVIIDHVHWEDWFCSPARTWSEVRWVARRVYMTREEGVKRFGPVFKDVPLDWLPKDITEAEALQPANMLFRRAQVYEIWDKPTRKVYWLAHAYNERLLDEREDPLRLTDFFPTPRPLYATMTTDSLIPVPDYQLYQDQAVQIDHLTARIEAIGKSIKVAGVYDAAQDGIQRLFAEGVENQLIPVNQWGSFSEQGGLKGCMDLLDIGMLAEVLGKLVEIRAQAKQDLYEVTGISDIIRGTTAASETATAQQIKAGFGTMRLRSRQNEVARFARDLIRISAEIICEHFNPRVLMLISDIGNYGAGADLMLAPQAMQLLKDDKVRPLRIDIEADSTILANQQQEQQARIQFLTMAGQFLQQALPAAQQTPQLAPLMGQMLLFGIRSFPQGAELEGAFEQAVKQMEDAAKAAANAPQQAPPDPKMMVAQAQVQDIQSKIADRQTDNQRADAEAQARMQLDAARAGVDQQRAHDDNAARVVQSFHDRTAEERNFVLEAARAREELAIKRMAARGKS
jgi:hypothetical protein